MVSVENTPASPTYAAAVPGEADLPAVAVGDAHVVALLLGRHHPGVAPAPAQPAVLGRQRVVRAAELQRQAARGDAQVGALVGVVAVGRVDRVADVDDIGHVLAVAGWHAEPGHRVHVVAKVVAGDWRRAAGVGAVVDAVAGAVGCGPESEPHQLLLCGIQGLNDR